MEEFKVCFIGIGSIAKRHIKNLHTISKRECFSLHIDCFRSSQRELPSDIKPLVDNVYFDVKDCKSDYHAVFVTNPTNMHLDTIKKFADKGQSFFVEKPLCSPKQDATELNNIPSLKGKPIYVACPLRYTNVIQYLKRNIDFTQVYSVRCISSSYLPEWRPGTDYRKTYSAHKNQGGGVSVDLIHEWDYLYYLLGKPNEIKSIIRKVSNLEIDSDDIAVYIASYPDKIVELHLDYFGRKPIRRIEIFLPDETVIGDLEENRILYQKSNRIVDLSEQRNDFQIRELEYFIGILNKTVTNENSMGKAMDVLKLTGGILK